MKSKVFLGVGIVIILLLAGLAGCGTSVAQTGTPAASSPSSSSAVEAPLSTSPVSINLNNQQGIWVTGEGKVTIVPDIANLYIGVMAQAAQVADAQSQASAAMDKVMAALTGAGIDNKDIKTQSYNIQQLTRYDNYTQESTITGYQVTNMLNVKIRAIDKVGAIIDAAVTAGGDLIRINGVNFSVDNPDQYYAQAREQAMQDARTKAQDIAKLAGITLGRITYVSESVNSQPNYPVYNYGAQGLAVPAPDILTSISPGQTDIDLYVQVNYAIQ